MLSEPNHKVAEIAEILDDIKADDQRAADIIDRIGNMVRKTEIDVRSMDLNHAIEQIMKVLAGEASNRGVLVKAELEPGFRKSARMRAATAGDPEYRTQRYGCDARSARRQEVADDSEQARE